MAGAPYSTIHPKNDLWHITWIDPVKKAFNRMTGRKVGDEIVQEYCTEERKRCQWLFSGITRDSFHWINRDSADNGENWRVRGEFFLQRRAAG